jgi:pilus assembly protein Flp/PilA
MDILTYWQRFCAPYIRARLAPIAKSERGASLVEYALLLALIAVVCILAVTFLGGKARDKFNQVGSSL